MAGAVVAIASVIGGVASAVAAVVVPIAAAVAAVVAPLVTTIGSVVAGIGQALAGTVGSLWTGLKTAVGPLVEGLKGAVETLSGAIDAATSPILTPIKNGLTLVNAKLKAIDAWVVAELKTVHDVIEIASAAATVKLLVDLVKGQASISEVIGKVAEGKSFETAVAIARLSNSIVTLGVGIVDRINTHWELIRKEVTTWDEVFKARLAEAIEVQKTELLSVVTPKLDTLGTYQTKVIKDVARLSRHIEDEAWFMWMLSRVLP